MADKTGIQWTDATWNPLVGCSLVSPACSNCYAMAQAHRIQRMTPSTHYVGTTKLVNDKPVWTGVVKQAPEHALLAPLRWKKPRKIFVNSMSDLFHESVPDAWIDRIFAIMALCPQHTFQVLTKRAKRMREYMTKLDTPARIATDGLCEATIDFPTRECLVFNATWPLPNVWLGVTAEDQARADERLDDLQDTPAAVKFVSIEPDLGSVDLEKWLFVGPEGGIDFAYSQSRMLDWIICGGESGPGARPMHPDWARSLRDQCAAAGVPFFFKQWGEFLEFDHLTKTYTVESEPELVDVFERACAHPLWLALDGRSSSRAHELPLNDQPFRLLDRVGKHRAGRLLDGREHNEFPNERS
jgi:protein gp37